MPVRKKPRSSPASQQTRVQASGHIHGFVHYLEAECGLAAITGAAYHRDLKSFCTWLEQNQACGLQQVGLPVMGDYLAYLHSR
ncbi:MAG: site-specific integrase, partial [Planctomycetaceae bacterium]